MTIVVISYLWNKGFIIPMSCKILASTALLKVECPS